MPKIIYSCHRCGTYSFNLPGDYTMIYDKHIHVSCGKCKSYEMINNNLINE